MKKLMFFSLIMILAVSTANASISVFAMDEAGFNAAVSNPLTFINFDNELRGTNYTGQNVQGVTFQSSGSPLFVVKGSDTFSPDEFLKTVGASYSFDLALNKLNATSGEMLLSPGGVVLGPGPNDNIANDDLELIFDNPVAAFGFDQIMQSADTYNRVFVTVYDSAGAVLLPTQRILTTDTGGRGAPGGSDFWGIVSSNTDIKRIVFDEFDYDEFNPDANVGYDTLRYAVPEPCTMLLIGLGGLFLRKRKA